MEFRLLGPLEVVKGDRIVDVGAGRPRALLALLLLHANEVVSADRLIDELWGGRPPATAAKGIQVYVSLLRKKLRDTEVSHNGDLLLTYGNGYAIRIDPGDLDIRRFEDSLADAQGRLAQDDPKGAAERLRAALALWRGPALQDFAYEPFARQEAERLERLRLEAVELMIEAELALGKHAHTVGELQSLVNEHPQRERLRGQLMLALYRCGRQSEALAVYREGQRLLQEEFGLEPTAELRELERKILTQHPDLASPAVEHPSARASPQGSLPATASRAEAEGKAQRRPIPRGPVLILAGAVLLAAAAALALSQRLGEHSTTTTTGRSLAGAMNAIVGLDASKQRADLAIPLPGRPTDLAAAGGAVWITTVDSSAVTSVDAKRRTASRTVPLRGRPDAVAIGGGEVWVADGARGVLAHFKPGYEAVIGTVRFPRGRSSARTVGGDRRPPPASLAVGGGGVWITNGSRTLIRVDPYAARIVRIRVGAPVNGVAVGGGAIWVLSSKTATVLRLDPRQNRVTHRIRIVSPRGRKSPTPVGIATATDSVWVLGGNPATVTRIDPASRRVVTTVPLGAHRMPSEIAAAGHTAWVANGDGTLLRLDAGSSAKRSIWVGGSLDRVATDGPRVWATTTALEQKLPRGSG